MHTESRIFAQQVSVVEDSTSVCLEQSTWAAARRRPVFIESCLRGQASLFLQLADVNLLTGGCEAVDISADLIQVACCAGRGQYRVDQYAMDHTFS